MDKSTVCSCEFAPVVEVEDVASGKRGEGVARNALAAGERLMDQPFTISRPAFRRDCSRAPMTRFSLRGAVSESVALIAGLDDMAVMGQTVKQRRGHLRAAEDISPFGKRQVGGDQLARVFIELAEQVKQQRPPA